MYQCLYVALADSFRFGISTVHGTIEEVCEDIWNILAPFICLYLQLVLSNVFCLKWSVPNCVGNIDKKHRTEMSFEFREHVLQL